jgi:hypothetical protein
MTELNDNRLNNQDDYLNTDNDRMQDAGNADAAQFNSQEQEKAVNQRQHDETVNVNSTNDDSTTLPGENKPLTTQGDINEVEEDFSGTTNLSLDQLKKERDPEGSNDE